MTPSSRIPTHQDILQAERHVYTGIYCLLLKRYTTSYYTESAPLMALAVTRELFSLSPSDHHARSFAKKNRSLIRQEVEALQDDEQIRRIVSDTLVIKAVFLHRHDGCVKNAAYPPIDKLRKLGIFLEGDKPPTPLRFIQAAWDFYAMASGIQHH